MSGRAGWVRAAVLAAVMATAGARPAGACSRVVYLGPNGTVVAGRSMDWMEDPGSNLWAFPAGMQRDGASGPRTVRWTSRHGSIVASLYEVATVDGINDAGLVANTLYLVESDYGTPRADQPTMSIAAWTQYVLDQYATVAEAVEALRSEPFAVIAPTLPNGSPAHGHMALSDPSGDSAILEYVGGKLVIHHGRQFQVMTNSPIFEQQLALNTYWQQIGGMTMLPGTVRAADRFARASFFVSALPPTDDPARAVASVVSVVRGVSVPLGLSVPGKPDIASTIWRTFYDQKAKTMYWDSATSPTIFWVPMAEIDLKPGAPVKRLTLAGGKTYGGDAAAAFAPATPFTFLPATSK